MKRFKRRYSYYSRVTICPCCGHWCNAEAYDICSKCGYERGYYSFWEELLEHRRLCEEGLEVEQIWQTMRVFDAKVWADDSSFRDSFIMIDEPIQFIEERRRKIEKLKNYFKK